MLTDNAAGEWQEEVKESCLTPEEELIETNEYLQRALKENMDLHNRLRDMRELVDSLQKQLAALEELKEQEKTSAEQPETEVEKLARELFTRIPDVSVESSFHAAQSWIAERDRRRQESGK